LYRTVSWIGVGVWLLLVIGGGYLLGRHDSTPGYEPVPALRFAGADLVYVLRRLATEADLVLALDEVRPLDGSEDLGVRMADVDLEAGPIKDALAKLKSATGGFDYDFRPGLLYVRSNLELEADTGIDRKELAGGTFEGDLRALGGWIQKLRPMTFMNVHLERGHPAGPRVRIDVPPRSSVLDVLLLYAKEAGVGWRMRRAGQRYASSPGQTAIVSTEVQPWKPLPRAHHTAPFRLEGSTIQNLARLSERTSTPFCVIDLAPLLGTMGMLDLSKNPDPGLDLEDSLRSLASTHAPGDAPPFAFELREECVVIRSEPFNRLPPLGAILKEKVEGGEFRGSLPELARWLTAHLPPERGVRIAGGEITEGAPIATLSVEPDATVEEVLIAFTRATRQGWYALIQDRSNPAARRALPWRGALLSDLLEWGEMATPY
jgi:hypothetical protein